MGLVPVSSLTVFPSRHHVSGSEDDFREALRRIEDECADRSRELRLEGKDLEADQLQRRVAGNLVLLREDGSCPGMENHGRHLNLREAGGRRTRCWIIWASPGAEEPVMATRGGC